HEHDRSFPGNMGGSCAQGVLDHLIPGHSLWVPCRDGTQGKKKQGVYQYEDACGPVYHHYGVLLLNLNIDAYFSATAFRSARPDSKFTWPNRLRFSSIRLP